MSRKNKFEVTDVVKLSEERFCHHLYYGDNLGVVVKKQLEITPMRIGYYIIWCVWPENFPKDKYYFDVELEKVEDYE